MAEKVPNSFQGGRNSDIDPTMIPNNQYVAAANCELVGDGSFYSLRNIKGTTGVQSLDANIEVLAVFANKYLISDELVDCLTVFSLSSTTFKIQCYSTTSDTLYDLFSETIDGDYTTDGIQGVNGPEGGLDIVYFTDNYKEPRYLKCQIPDSYSANFLSSYDLSLLRKGANGTIVLSSVASGGTLLSGSYQFAYRMADPTNKKFTKWSSLTNPIHVYSAENGTSVVNSGIGLITDRKVTLTITPSTAETDEFDQIQVAVVENIGPTPAITASLLEIESIPSTSLSFEYKSNSQIGTIPLEDITVDLAQIERVKTLAIKDNRLFGGNIHYTDLEFDNGTPAITSGSIITQASSGVDTFSDDEYASKYRGHWRGEVYRYGVVYYDKNGNKSSVQPLDLSGVTDNGISGSLTDLKFPDRTDPDYTLFNSSGQIQSLGLRLTGLNNHPSWAVALEIVRVNRVGRYKNILFQTPIIPMTRVFGVGALETYPNTVRYDNDGHDRTVDDATPMTNSYTLVPKNLFFPEYRNIVKVSTTSATQVTGEVKYDYGGGFAANGCEYSMIFPSDSMYNGNVPFAYSGAEKISFIDMALTKLSIDEDSPSKDVAYIAGDDVNTNISGTFHALTNNQYYFNNGHGKSALTTLNKPITDYKFFDNFGVTTTVAGKSVMDYDALQTGGVDLGYKPNIQRSAVVRIGNGPIPDVSSSSRVFSAATWNVRSSGGAITSASASLVYESNVTNKYINEYSTWDENDYVGVIGIANVHLGLGDDRYGDNNSLHEYISTGCKYTFSSSEIATLEGGGDVTLGDLDVWGGDCFVGPHVFKVADTGYSIVNQPKNNGSAQSDDTLLPKWNNIIYRAISYAGFLCIPVAVENAAQYVQVILESEYNGEVREADILTGTSASVPIMEGDADTSRTPLTYRYNINLSKINDQKIFVPKPQFSFEQNVYGSRVIYSDLKIYNSDVSGFDVFRVGNIHDVEEKFRPITKLAVAGNDLYSIHENGIVYLPTGSQQLQETDAGTIAVGSGLVIGKHLIVDSERGSQHHKSIVETGGVIYMADNRNKNVYALSGQQLQSITKDNETIFRSMFGSKIDSKYLMGVYDSVRGEYWIANTDPSTLTSNAHVFNEKLGVWVSSYSVGKNLRGYGMTNQKLYLVGANGTATDIFTMYTGACGQLFGQSVDSSVRIYVNAFPENPKVFDAIKINSSEPLDGVEFAVIRDSDTQSCILDLSSVTSREGNYRTYIMRDSLGGRLRGMYLTSTYIFGTDQTSLRSIVTVLRPSSRYR